MFRTKTDIPQIFLELECIFCGSTSRFMSSQHDVITKANPFPDAAKFMSVGFRNNKTQQVRR